MCQETLDVWWTFQDSIIAYKVINLWIRYIKWKLINDIHLCIYFLVYQV